MMTASFLRFAWAARVTGVAAALVLSFGTAPDPRGQTLAPPAGQSAGVSTGTAQTAGVPGHVIVPARPKLVVLLVVDQFRADYVDRYGHMWTGGLRRLMTEGAYFRRAAYPYLNTVTCVGHATISTGSFPQTHGIVGNAWFDRASGRSVGCADDPSAQLLSYSAPATGGYSAWRLLVPALADELRAQLPGPTRVVTMSMKPRTAIMLAGRRADAATWFHAPARGMVTSTAFAGAPVPWVKSFLEANPIERDFGKAWQRLLPASRYLFEDAAEGEQPPTGWTGAFPHPLGARGAAPGADFYEAWGQSPFSDALLGQLAARSVDALGLGRGAGTDFLGVSFSALDLVGHDFGPRSHEVQDVLARLDRTIGALLTHLDRTVGPGRFAIGLAGDHGVSLIPEQATALALGGGRLPMQPIQAKTEEVLANAFGPGTHVLRFSGSDLYLAPATAGRLGESAAARAALMEAIGSLPGVARVLFGADLAGRRPEGDRDARAAALSFFPGRSGDVVVVPRPYWFLVSGDGSKMSGSATTHGTLADYDRRVPVVLYGAGVKRGVFLGPASPADIAPTLAFLCGVTLAKPDGQVLVEALR